MASYTADMRTQEHTALCSCPACLGLECLERPRYFAGQLLTEAELNSEQAYVLAKNRLHNRYLHGWGVVCGLEVVCHDCEGWVTVQSGYAIDPCGNDIIVCADHAFDVIKAIRECREARRRRRRGDCDPYEPPRDQSCTEVEEHWCITLAYEEKEARPITALRRDRAQQCGCCSSNGRQCGCRCHSQQTSRAPASYTSAQSSGRMQSGVGKTIAPCEPTRLLEGYRLAVVEAPADCIAVPQKGREENLLSWLFKLLPKDTLLVKIIECLSSLGKFVSDRVPSNDQAVLLSTALSSGTAGTAAPYTPRDQHEAYCRLRQAVIDLYLDNPHNVRCQLLHTVEGITCPAPGANDTVATYTPLIQPCIYHLATLLVQYVLDCICQALLPSCAPDPHDDRLILACVTLRGDKIMRICNFSCRHYAGSFPSLYYWLSLVPIVPLIALFIRQICCGPDLVRTNSPLVNDLLNLLNRLDPSGSLRQALFAEDFALPKMYAGHFTAMINNLSFAGLAEALRPGAVNLPTLVGKSVAQANRTFAQAGVIARYRDVRSAEEVSHLKNLTVAPFAASGDTVVVYRIESTIVGFGPYDAEQQLVDQQAELTSMKQELAAMRSEVARLTNPHS
jgi:hypothetical protein